MLSPTDKIGIQLAKSLALTSEQILAKCFDLKPVYINNSNLMERLKESGANQPLVSLWDYAYAIIPFSKWLDIIQFDWIKESDYIKEMFDCDNLAYFFSSRVSRIFKLNSACAVYGEVFDKKTGISAGYHYWNGLLTSDLGFFHFEPQNHQYIINGDGQHIIMGEWKYVPLHFYFF